MTAPAWKPDPQKIRLLAIDLLERGVAPAAWPRLYDLLDGLGGADDVLEAVCVVGGIARLTTTDAARLRQEGQVRS